MGSLEAFIQPVLVAVAAADIVMAEEEMVVATLASEEEAAAVADLALEADMAWTAAVAAAELQQLLVYAHTAVMLKMQQANMAAMEELDLREAV